MHYANRERHLPKNEERLGRPSGGRPGTREPKARIGSELRERLRDFALQNGGASVTFCVRNGIQVLQVSDRHRRTHEMEIGGDLDLWFAALDAFDRKSSEPPSAGLFRFLASPVGGRT